MMHDSTSTKQKMMRPSFYETLTGKILGNNYYYGPRITNSSNTQMEKTRKLAAETSSNEDISCSTTTPLRKQEGVEVTNNKNVGKRKASSFSTISNELDLNLSLGIQKGDDDEEEDRSGEYLSLSLCSPSSSMKRMKQDTTAEENVMKMKGASTLDLTL